MMPPSAVAPVRWPLGRAILRAAALAGTLDIGAAFALTAVLGRGPLVVLQFVASGLWGPAALGGGWPVALAGLGLHYAIATAWTALYFAVAARVPALRRRWVLGAGALGTAAWLAMNLVVLPLSRVPARPLTLGLSVANWLILVACIGLPVAGAARRYFGPLRPMA